MEITLDLLIEDWLKENSLLRDHFRVFRYKDSENPTSWPTALDNYVGMLCDFGELAFVIESDHVYRHDEMYSKDLSIRVQTKLLAADPHFFKKLAEHLALKHHRLHGPRGCKLYEFTEGSAQGGQIVFDYGSSGPKIS